METVSGVRWFYDKHAVGMRQVQNAGHRLQVTGYWSQVTGHRSQVTGHRSQVTGHRSQVTGYRSQEIEIEEIASFRGLQRGNSLSSNTIICNFRHLAVLLSVQNRRAWTMAQPEIKQMTINMRRERSLMECNFFIEFSVTCDL